jgi:predicted HTH transcriptional regulator
MNINALDLQHLLVRESEQVEWKENVADVESVVRTIVAFANDLQYLGGGTVVCGAAEEKDEAGFPKVKLVGLSAARFKEIEGKVLAACREQVHPPVSPLVQEHVVSDDRRVLCFLIAATSHAHTYRTAQDSGKYFIRISRETREAKNGLLRELLVRKQELEPWDRRICQNTTLSDLDLNLMRAMLQKNGSLLASDGVEPFLSDTETFSPLVPPLCKRDALHNLLRPRNFAVLLFGFEPQKFIYCSHTILSIYPGTDRSDPHAERHELTGSILSQAKKAIELLNVQSYTAFDKTDFKTPNALKYPYIALTEAVVNAIVHRNYELDDPIRITVFSDRIEIVSSGGLLAGVSLNDVQSGKATAKWRNQTLSWFFNRLQLSQAEGQGISSIIKSMKQEGCPAPVFEANETRVTCKLPAHPRHALTREYQRIEEALSLGEFSDALTRVNQLIELDPTNFRSVDLLVEVCQVIDRRSILVDYIKKYNDSLRELPSRVILKIADFIAPLDVGADAELDDLVANLYRDASLGRIEEMEVRRIATGLSKGGNDHAALTFLDKQLAEHSEWRKNPSILWVRGNALLGMAKLCSKTARTKNLPKSTKSRAWDDCLRFIRQGRVDLDQAQNLSSDAVLMDLIQKSLTFSSELHSIAVSAK